MRIPIRTDEDPSPSQPYEPPTFADFMAREITGWLMAEGGGLLPIGVTEGAFLLRIRVAKALDGRPSSVSLTLTEPPGQHLPTIPMA